MRSGQVRILIGSTQKMGAGTNVQDKLVALHDLDCPWRPRDLTQRKGRIERQNNENEKVHVFRYVTEATFDAYLWQTVENKQKFGYERTLFVLAATVRNHEHDGRYSRSNKDWARTVPVFDTERSIQYAARSHPVLVDAFLTTARHEHLLSLPLTKEDIKAEALNILCKFQDAREPNSPNGTHYMAQVSSDFLARASTKDTDHLMAMLPFQSLSLSGLEGRRGTYALIVKDENRFQKLVLRKPSVRKKLQEKSAAPDAPKSPGKNKSKGQER